MSTLRSYVDNCSYVGNIITTNSGAKIEEITEKRKKLIMFQWKERLKTFDTPRSMKTISVNRTTERWFGETLCSQEALKKKKKQELSTLRVYI